MNKAKKILALVLCAVLLVGASIAGTVAYLTDNDTVKNTFTVGKVDIYLDETDVDGSGTGVIEETGRDQGNAYKLMPGIDVVKDPVVTVKAGSADCYVRVKVTVSVPNWTNDNNLFFTAEEIEKDFKYNPFAQWVRDFETNYFCYNDNKDVGFNTEIWTATDPTIREKTFTYYLTYKNATDNNIVKGGNADITLAAPFTYISPSNNLTSAQMAALAGMTIDVEAHAIQADGFVPEDRKTAEQVAWDAFESQN